MIKPLEILRVAQQGIDPSLDMLSQKEHSIQGSVQYSIKRFSGAQSFGTDDTGMLVYHYHKNDFEQNYLELRYCISGNRYS